MQGSVEAINSTLRNIKNDDEKRKVKTGALDNSVLNSTRVIQMHGNNENNSIQNGLTYDSLHRYGLRVEDEEISLNYPDAVKIIGIFESLDTSSKHLGDILNGDSVDTCSVDSIVFCDLQLYQLFE